MLNLERGGGRVAPFLLTGICIYDRYMIIFVYMKESNDTRVTCEQSQRQRDDRDFKEATEGLLSQNQKPRTCYLVRPRTRLKAHRLASQWGLKIIHNYLKSQFSHLKECQLKKSAADLIG